LVETINAKENGGMGTKLKIALTKEFLKKEIKQRIYDATAYEHRLARVMCSNVLWRE
jgi:hypothetical protein